MNRLPALPVFLAAVALLQLSAPAADSQPAAPTTRPTTGPSTRPTTAPVVEVQPDGSLLLKAEGARIHGYKLHVEPKPIPTIIFWIDASEYPEWPQAVAKKGTYSVEITYSSPAKAGGEFYITAAANKVTAKTETTDDWHTFTTVNIGKLTVLNDDTSIAVRYGAVPSAKFKRASATPTIHALMNIRSIKLTPTTEDPQPVKPVGKKKR